MPSKTALVTGGNKGIGLEVTRMFVALGFEVIVLARDFEGFAFADHDNVHTMVCDLTNENQLMRVIDQIDHVDILVNNAGVMYAITFDQYSQEKVDSMIALNLKAPIKLIEKLAAKMPKGGTNRQQRFHRWADRSSGYLVRYHQSGSHQCHQKFCKDF